MRVLIVNTYDISGGAARAAYRLHRTLLELGVDSQMLVQSKMSDDFSVLTEANKIRRKLNSLRPFLNSMPTRFYKDRVKTPFNSGWISSNSVINTINELKPDIVHLHWICDGMLSVGDIAKIKAPIVWSLHDDWAYTGGCHIKWTCKKYRHKCGACPILGSNKEYDLSRFVFNAKRKVFSKKQMTIVGLSRWICETSQSSALLSSNRHVNIPNLIDVDVFKPFDVGFSRSLLGLPLDKKIVIFGANNATSDINKGFLYLSQALQLLNGRDDVEFAIFGSSQPKSSNLQHLNVKLHYLGHLYDNVSLVALYNAADVMVVPSLQENLANAIMESLSCGTPVVAFDVGGNSDMVEHKVNGYLAKCFEPADLKEGIEWILEDSMRYRGLCRNAREKVLKEFESKKVAQKYINLYCEVMHDS